MKNLQKLFNPKALLVTMGLLAGGANMVNAQAPYCTMSYPSGYFSHGFNQVTIGTYTQSPTFSSAYGNFLGQNVPMVAGTPTNVSINAIGWVSVGIAVDFNNDNDFEDQGEVLALPAYIANDPMLYSFSITVPPNVVSGNYRMRIWTRLANAGNGPYANGDLPCGTYGYGRYADYTMVVTNNATCLAPSGLTSIATSNSAALSWTASTSTPANYRWKVVADGADPNTVPAVVATATGTTAGTTANATGLAPATAYDAYVKSLCSASDSSVWTLANDFTTLCDGTPATGVASSSVTSVCPTINFNLVLTGVTPAPGITYQWQSSPSATGTFTNITGATTTTYATSLTATTYYRCIVTCLGSSLTSTSNVISVALSPATSCYCTPTYTNGCGNGSRITSFSTTGAVANITNLNTGCAISNGYSDYTTMSMSGVQSTTFNYAVEVGSFTGGVKIWADWNQDGIFDVTTEEVAASTAEIAIGGTFSGAATIPASALTGTTRLRVRVVESSISFNPCSNYGWGETEDYVINVLSATGLCVTPINLAVSGATTNAATVNFAAPPVGNTPTNYIYELRTDGTTAGSGATGLVANATITTTTANLTNLSPASNYVFYVRTFCAVNDSSAWVSIPFSTSFDTLTPVSLTQFNADVIANGIGHANTSTNNDVDGVSWALLAADFQATSTSTLPTYAVPNNRIVVNGLRKYRLANYSGNNSLRQTLSQTNGTVRFIAPKRANKVYIMGVSGSAISNFNAIIHFADGTTQIQAMNFADWYTSNGQVVVSGLGRINRTNNTIEGTLTGGPRFHDTSIVIATANRNKQIDSIVIQRTGTTAGISNVMAVSIVPNTTQPCKLPGYLTIANPNCMGGTLTWQGNGTNTNYEISYGAIGTLANAGTIIPVTGVAGQNTHQFVNASTNTSLQLYVRASCGSGSYSDWVGPLEVTLPATTVTPTFSTIPPDVCMGATPPTLPLTSDNSITGTWSPATISNTTSGSYTFTPNASFTCAIPVTVAINVSSQIVPTFTQIAPICEGTTAPVLPTTSNNTITGTWSPAVVSNTATGTYTFTPTTTGSCVGTATMTITVNPEANETVFDTICSSALPLTWNGITVNAGGASAATYTVASVNGCDSTTTLNLNVVTNTNPSVSIAASPFVSVPSGQTVTFTATLTDAAGSTPTYQWIKSGAPIAGATNNTWSAVAGTDFLNGDNISLSVDGFNDCAAAQSITSNTLEMVVSVGIGDKELPKGFKLYPNPTSNIVKVEGLNKGDKYMILDVLGRILNTTQIETNQVQNIDLSNYTNGTYLIIFENNVGYKWMQKVSKL